MRRVLLRDGRTGRYFSGGGRWAKNPQAGLDFEDSGRAVQCAIRLALEDYEIVVKPWEESQRLAA